MFKTIAILSLLTIVACGKPTTESSPPQTPVTKSILNKFQAVDNAPLHGISELDFSTFTLGVAQELDYDCNGNYGNSGLVNGVDRGMILVDGGKTSGIIQIGHTKYVGASDPVCRQLSKERYSYQMDGEILTLCMLNYRQENGELKYCAKYSVK